MTRGSTAGLRGIANAGIGRLISLATYNLVLPASIINDNDMGIGNEVTRSQPRDVMRICLCAATSLPAMSLFTNSNPSKDPTLLGSVCLTQSRPLLRPCLVMVDCEVKRGQQRHSHGPRRLRRLIMNSCIGEGCQPCTCWKNHQRRRAHPVRVGIHRALKQRTFRPKRRVTQTPCRHCFITPEPSMTDACNRCRQRHWMTCHWPSAARLLDGSLPDLNPLVHPVSLKAGIACMARGLAMQHPMFAAGNDWRVLPACPLFKSNFDRMLRPRWLVVGMAAAAIAAHIGVTTLLGYARM